MKSKTSYEPTKSSFLSLAKDTSLIIDKLLNNKKLLKLIYYSTKDVDKEKDLTSEQIKSLFENKQISNIPKILVDKEKLTYVVISFDDFTPSGNTFYRDCLIEIKILCHFDDWDLDNFQLRPYAIAGEIDALLNESRLSGIGRLIFLGADQNVYDDEYGGVTLKYYAVHGNEDEMNPLV